MNQIKILRKRKCLSQQDLSKILGVNQTAISQWERGITNPSYEMLIKLSKYFNIPIDELLNSKSNNIYSLSVKQSEDSNHDFEVSLDYQNGIIAVLHLKSNQRVIIPYRIKIENGGSFISNLKMLRKINNLTQGELAIKCGLSYSTIASYEKGLRKPTGYSLCVLANYFGIDAESLLGTDINKEDKAI